MGGGHTFEGGVLAGHYGMHIHSHCRKHLFSVHCTSAQTLHYSDCKSMNLQSTKTTMGCTLSRRRCAVLRLSHLWVSKLRKSLGCWSASRFLSPLSCCWAVNRLPYPWTRSGVVFYPPSSQPRPPSRWHHEWHVPKRYVNPYISIVNPLRTYIHTSTTSD